jgi:hypothetical protein
MLFKFLFNNNAEVILFEMSMCLASARLLLFQVLKSYVRIWSGLSLKTDCQRVKAESVVVQLAVTSPGTLATKLSQLQVPIIIRMSGAVVTDLADE